MTLERFSLLLLVAVVAVTMPACAAIEGIFKAGVGVGIFMAVVVVGLALFVISKARA